MISNRLSQRINQIGAQQQQHVSNVSVNIEYAEPDFEKQWYKDMDVASAKSCQNVQTITKKAYTLPPNMTHDGSLTTMPMKPPTTVDNKEFKMQQPEFPAGADPTVDHQQRSQQIAVQMEQQKEVEKAQHEVTLAQQNASLYQKPIDMNEVIQSTPDYVIKKQQIVKQMEIEQEMTTYQKQEHLDRINNGERLKSMMAPERQFIPTDTQIRSQPQQILVQNKQNQLGSQYQYNAMKDIILNAKAPNQPAVVTSLCGNNSFIYNQIQQKFLNTDNMILPTISIINNQSNNFNMIYDYLGRKFNVINTPLPQTQMQMNTHENFSQFNPQPSLKQTINQVVQVPLQEISNFTTQTKQQVVAKGAEINQFATKFDPSVKGSEGFKLMQNEWM